MSETPNFFIDTTERLIRIERDVLDIKKLLVMILNSYMQLYKKELEDVKKEHDNNK